MVRSLRGAWCVRGRWLGPMAFLTGTFASIRVMEKTGMTSEGVLLEHE